MPALPRRHLSHASLVVLLAIDLLVLVALLVNQFVTDHLLLSWAVGAVVAAGLLPWMLKIADRVLAMARTTRNVPLAGGSFP